MARSPSVSLSKLVGKLQSLAGRFLKSTAATHAVAESCRSIVVAHDVFTAGPVSKACVQLIRADANVAQGGMSPTIFVWRATVLGDVWAPYLRNETQQLHLVVLPEIDASTAALALGVANPILGLGAFLAQYVLRNPLSKAFALEYDIGGTWADPTITRRGRAAATDAESSK